MLSRPELDLLKSKGVSFSDPTEVVTLFETRVAEICGSKYAVAVDCNTHAVELCLRYLQPKSKITIPSHTYPSIPMTLEHLGLEWEFSNIEWQGSYHIDPLPIIDASLQFRYGIHQPQSFTCLSFQFKKRIPIGRGGMILCDDDAAYEWLTKASYDGRSRGVKWHEDLISMLGFHYYMTPEDAARGLLLLDELGSEHEDMGGWQNYPDLRTFPVFSK